MRAFITGGLGQIGSHIAEMLLDRGDKVVVLDNLETGRAEHLPQHENRTVTIGSIANKELVDQQMEEFSLMWLFTPQLLIKIPMIGTQTP